MLGGLVREGCTDLLAHLHEEACSPGRARVGPLSALTPACYHSDPNFPLRGDINQSQEWLFCVPSLCQGLGYGGMHTTNLLCTADSLWGEERSRSKRLSRGGRVPSEPTAGLQGRRSRQARLFRGSGPQAAQRCSLHGDHHSAASGGAGEADATGPGGSSSRPPPAWPSLPPSPGQVALWP